MIFLKSKSSTLCTIFFVFTVLGSLSLFAQDKTNNSCNEMLRFYFKCCENNGKIRLKTSFDHSFRLRRSDGTGQALPLQIQVCDNGPGLPADIRDEIFDPFVSGKENGTGLGLALASKIISDHDGWISVDSTPGNTVFTISLAAINIKNNSLVSEVS